MTRKCYNKPNRKQPRVFTARDAGRVVAYARNDGANDAELMANIAQAFGQREMLCLLFQILDILNTAAFLAGLLGILKGMQSLMKAIKILATGKVSRLTLSFIELVMPARFAVSLATFLLYIGSAEIIAGGLIVFVTGISNNLSLYLLMKHSCELEIKPLNVQVDDLDVGLLADTVEHVKNVVKELIP